MSDFALHPRLVADTSMIADWPLCRLLLMEDARYPWVILVPRRAGLVEFTELSTAERGMLMEEAARVAAVLTAMPGVTKLNLGALGNQVAQFHLHVIGRWPGDPAWPDPVWGRGKPVPYQAAERQARIARVRDC